MIKNNKYAFPISKQLQLFKRTHASLFLSPFYLYYPVGMRKASSRPSLGLPLLIPQPVVAVRVRDDVKLHVVPHVPRMRVNATPQAGIPLQTIREMLRVLLTLKTGKRPNHRRKMQDLRVLVILEQMFNIDICEVFEGDDLVHGARGSNANTI
mmetsp:Transcript_35964/g.88594  ORF Transcript_35964/g.88594 Transcript_35964/m.88594 type:complete len:153 (+) Transcript_35964:159-617(+)